MSHSPHEDEVAAELRAARPWQPLGLWWLAVVGLALAALLLVTENLRAYGFALGGTLGLLALLRAVLPESRAGGLAVRGRGVDAVTLALLGGAVAVVSANLRLL